MVLTCHFSDREMEVGGSGIEGHPELHGLFEASLDYMRPYLKRIVSVLSQARQHRPTIPATWNLGSEN